MVHISKFLLVSLLAGLPIFATPLDRSAGAAASLSHVKTGSQLSASANNINFTSSRSHPDHASPADHVLEARAPLFKFIKKIASSIYGRELTDNDVEGFMARDSNNHLVTHTRASGFEDLEARTPLLKFIKKLARPIFGRELDDNEIIQVLARIDAQDLEALLPNDADYQNAIARWAVNAQQAAQVVVFPKDASDVRLAIAFARLHSLELAIRGGGHNTGGGSSSEGMVIDLSRLELGGLALGGSIGWLSGAHGLVIDNMAERWVHYHNQWWAIRGGECNFGVVTQIVLKLHPKRLTVYGGAVVYSSDKLEALFDLLKEFRRNITENEAIWLTLGCEPMDCDSAPSPNIALIMFYNGSEEDGRLNFKKFFDIVPIPDETREMPYEHMNGVTHNTDENLVYARRAATEINANIAEGQTSYLGPVNRGYGNYDQDTHENEDDEMDKSSSRLLFSENYPKLQLMKKKYEPDNVFFKCNALDALNLSLEGDIVLPNDAGYKDAIARWAVNAERAAQLVVFPKHAADVRLAIAFSRAHSLELAIRGGGHSTGGASSSEGMVIDLSRYINTVEVDVEKKLAYVGGGCTWKQVDEAAIQHGLATVAGTINHEPDLWWAIRGGGCNFGVITQFVLRLHPQRRTIYGGLVVYTPDKLDALFDLFEEFRKTITEKEAIWFTFGCDSTASNPTPDIVLTMFYNGPEEEGRLNYKKYFDLGPILDQTREMPYEEMNATMNAALEHGHPRLMKGAYQVEPHLPSLQKALQRIGELSNEEHTAVIGFEYISLAKINSVQNGDCAHFRTKNANIFIVTTWKHNTPENLAYARQMSREISAIITEGQAKYLGPVNRGYGNYDQDTYEDEGVVIKDSAQLMFQDNYPKLQLLKKKYDPNNVFFKWFPIVPAPQA
ncbi:hypothetical protein CVT24_006531 [Panaeolus cyanescens]|uniref:FAD-binding PCMH-type domain-containing protein n=1 Tax=Panaeolus cyanescens TaxID=181874 RepID=A0A409VZU4_9AGAR|nr:hypothetical protein CVT24_006531 [Panaeolus cyanescens]